jgi:hypothetical protein
MKTTIEAYFPNLTSAQNAATWLNSTNLIPGSSALVESRAGKPASLLSARVDSGRHDRIMKITGMAGIVIGCAIGFALIPLVERREIMHLLILPFSGAFWGLGLAFTAVMLLSESLEQFFSGTIELTVAPIAAEDARLSVSTNSVEVADTVCEVLINRGATVASIATEEAVENAPRAVASVPAPQVTLLSKSA